MIVEGQYLSPVLRLLKWGQNQLIRRTYMKLD